VNLASVIDELVEERGLDREVLNSIICESMLAAFSKKYPELELKVDFDKQLGEIKVSVHKMVVESVDDEDFEISLKKAQKIDKNIQLGDQVWVPFEGSIGRIEIVRAKQVIAATIRQIEAGAIYNEFKDREGSIVYGVIHKCERGGAVVKIDDHLAFLPKNLSIPSEKCSAGFALRALLKEVLPEPRNDYQLVLDRSSERFLEELFKLEIPEIFEKLVEIKRIVRTAGYKSKVVVVSNDKNIDPVGTCVGVGGSRIKPILKELGGEKIDIIAWSDSLDTMIKNALKPAQINRVQLSDDNSSALVWLDEDQRSIAIGKMGQNIALASRLTGVNIQLAQASSSDNSTFKSLSHEKTLDEDSSGEE
jgi:N utilization substance protein A